MFAARGKLITEAFAREVLPGLPGQCHPPPPVRRALESWSQRCDDSLGPASSVRTIVDAGIVPLLRALEYRLGDRTDAGSDCEVHAWAGESPLVVLVSPWGEPLPQLWRRAVIRAVAADARWCLCFNGRALRLVDGRRTWTRDYLELDVPALGTDTEAQWLLWSVARADAMAMQPPLLDRVAEMSRRHGADVCRALGRGVLEALELLVGSLDRPRNGAHDAYDGSLTVLYRVLFLLFAEARGLLPLWHPVYRERYSLETIVTSLLAGRRERGLWQTLRAISRLAHAGCTAGELRVTAFNGRLFSPRHGAGFDRRAVPDEVLGSALVAVSTTAGTAAGNRTRISYRDLDVEQLGAIYEQVLEYEPERAGAATRLTRTGDARKSTGTFYTPRPVTAYLVRHALEPLVRGRSSSDILALRILDPAMGSGAFLVSACRYLSTAAEEALIREGRWHPHDVTPADRAALRREIAARCLFGVDLNPMAVQLARLSLWLATLAGDKPLTFLDHHLVSGDSLVGTTPEDAARPPGPRAGRTGPRAPLPLFDDEDIGPTLTQAVRVRLELTAESDDTPAIVRAKEKTLARLLERGSSLARWTRVMDLWCAGWFWDEGTPPDRRTFAELAAHILRGTSSLPDRVAAPLIARLEAVASRRRFVHWPVTFPEAFLDGAGAPVANPGFDAVVGNPPWDVVRGDSGEGGTRAVRKDEARQLARFVRESGVYRVDARGHVNRYQLFVERALQLTRAGGRIGLVLPSGVASDAGAAPLRRRLFDCADVDEITGVDNREGIFPIHRGLRFVLLSATRGRGLPREGAGPGHTNAAASRPIRCRFGITASEELEREQARAPLLLTRGLLARLSGEDDLGIPELGCERDLRLVERICSTVPRLSDPAGWNARFGRELNASDDRGAFTDYAGEPDARPVVEGKLIEPFRVSLDRCRLQLRPDAAAQIRIPRRARIAYRDVASAGNRLTLIAALLPARAVTTHTLFCLKSPMARAAQHVLCALMNSFVANYLIRLRVNTHVTLALTSRLPVPLVRPGERTFDRLSALSAALRSGAAPVEEEQEYAELQAICARLYALDAGEFEHVLSTFPLVGAGAKARALRAFSVLR